MQIQKVRISLLYVKNLLLKEKYNLYKFSHFENVIILVVQTSMIRSLSSNVWDEDLMLKIGTKKIVETFLRLVGAETPTKIEAT